MSFQADIDKWIEKAKNALADKAADVVNDATKLLIDNSPHYSKTTPDGRSSPFSTGEFVNNWNVGATVSGSETNISIASREAKINELKSAVTRQLIMSSPVVYIYNTSHYAREVEYLGWKISKEYAPRAQAVGVLSTKYGKS